MKKGAASLVVILVVSLLLSILFAARVPFGENPDEQAHRDYIRLLIENKGFVKFVPQPPTVRTAGAADTGTQLDSPTTPWETHQPPLYYLLCIPVHQASGGNLFAVRMVAAVIQLFTIWLCWAAIRDLFPDKESLAFGVAAFVTLLPVQAQLSGAINNDSLTTLICAALFWRFGALVLRGQTVRDALITGVLLGIGLLTKSTVLQLLPGMIVAYAFAVRARKLTAGEAGMRFAAVLGVGILIASPWLVRNQMLYGDPLALSIYKETGTNFTPQDIMTMFGWDTADYARHTGIRTFVSFWYLLKPIVRDAPAGLAAVTLLLALGGALGAYRWATRGGSEEVGERGVVGMFAIGAALLIPFFAKFIFSVFQAQGRYFLPALLPIAAITVLGWSGLTGTRGRVIGPVIVGVVLLGLLLLQIANL